MSKSCRILSLISVREENLQLDSDGISFLEIYISKAWFDLTEENLNDLKLELEKMKFVNDKIGTLWVSCWRKN